MVSNLISHARRPVGRGPRRWAGVGALSALACGGASAAYVQTSLDLRPTDAALSFHAVSALTPVSFASALAS